MLCRLQLALATVPGQLHKNQSMLVFADPPSSLVCLTAGGNTQSILKMDMFYFL